jgi:hypothetical protein
MAFAAHLEEDEDLGELAEHMPAIERLSIDLAIAARTMEAKQARYLVDAYYSIQDIRKRFNSQIKAMEKSARKLGIEPEPHLVIDWMLKQATLLEGQIKKALDEYTEGHLMGGWMRQIYGIGPVISAGVLAHLEEPRNTAGQIYAFAGIAGKDQKPWAAGQKRPYNAQLKTLCWHAGQSFMKFHDRPACFYGKLYVKRKAFEQMMSDSGQRTETAAEWRLKFEKAKKTQSDTYKIYCTGKLPPSQIDGRARRHAVKIFLSHVNEIWLTKLGRPIPAPFPIGRLGHADYIPPPIPA